MKCDTRNPQCVATRPSNLHLPSHLYADRQATNNAATGPSRRGHVVRVTEEAAAAVRVRTQAAEVGARAPVQQYVMHNVFVTGLG